jgi:hypothetical protein
MKRGDLLVKRGRLDETLKAYHNGIAIAERLAAADGDNTGWQRHLSVSYTRIGNVLQEQSRLDDALTAYRDSLAIAR